VNRFVRDADFDLELPETRVKPEERVDRKQPPLKRDLRMSEDCAGLVVERADKILTEIPLELPVAAVSDYSVRPAKRAVDAVTPGNLRQQVRGDRFRSKRW